MEDKLMALAEFLNVSSDKLQQTEYDENEFESKEYNESYLVFDDYDEAEKYAKENVLNTFDDLGLNSFTEYARDYIVENFIDEDFLSDALREGFEFYVYDIKEEDGDKYANRMIDEAVEAGVLSEEDAENEDYDEDEVAENLIEHLCEQYEGNEVQYFIDNFGSLEEAFGKDNLANHIDLDAMAEWCVEEDGVAHFVARYDGKENEVDYEGTTYYIYRTN